MKGKFCEKLKQKWNEKWKKKLKLWGKLILNWRFVVCFGIGWMVTNGWSYIMLLAGWITGIEWMTGVALAYLAFLWVPFTPEKAITVAIALFLVRKLFPKHNKELEQQIYEATADSSDKQKKKRFSRKKKNADTEEE